ncbi:hypothetical protein TWF718_010228 [Orbilia javanica]|uniref:Zn(2)-C6 fungal-type domain-containing protein n=1 Tax=Orbilia javanica TaxID=47235 RepID=A0AAN8RDW1_9PEZI
MRRTHRKSRYGCKECKQRHIRCDENRPSCANCSKSVHQCSYTSTSVNSVLVSRSPVVSKRQAQERGSNPSTPSSSEGTVDNPRDDQDQQPPEHMLDGEVYSLHHIQLLLHFQNEIPKTLGLSSDIFDLIVENAIRTPYLMDQVLATSAAHKSTIQGDKRQFYLHEATRLQTRALALFNQCNQENSLLSDKINVCVFLFSSLLGHHALFNALSLRAELSSVLDEFTRCLKIHRGVCALAAQSWPEIQSQLGPEIFKYSALVIGEGDNGTKGSECSALVDLIVNGELSGPLQEACSNAVSILQSIFDALGNPQSSKSRRLNLVQQWPVRIPTEYINALSQRRPEALIILAYYAVMLHGARDYWAFGDSGAFLIQSITGYLGSYWASWLAWPNDRCRDREQNIN